MTDAELLQLYADGIPFDYLVREDLGKGWPRWKGDRRNYCWVCGEEPGQGVLVYAQLIALSEDLYNG